MNTLEFGLCQKNHQEIYFKGDDCPLCKMREELYDFGNQNSKLKQLIKYYEEDIENLKKELEIKR